MSLLPGDNMIENYTLALLGGETSLRQQAAAGGADAVGQPGHGAGHRDRQDRDLAAVGLRDRLLPLPGPQARASG